MHTPGIAHLKKQEYQQIIFTCTFFGAVVKVVGELTELVEQTIWLK